MGIIEKEIIQLIAEIKDYPPEAIAKEDSFEFIGMDSLNLATLIIACEKKFDIQIDDAFNITCVKDMINIVEDLI